MDENTKTRILLHTDRKKGQMMVVRGRYGKLKPEQEHLLCPDVKIVTTFLL
jgi:hypothetical protein